MNITMLEKIPFELNVEELMRRLKVDDALEGLAGVGYDEADAPSLADAAWPQQRLLKNAPIDVDKGLLANIFGQALRYW